MGKQNKFVGGGKVAKNVYKTAPRAASRSAPKDKSSTGDNIVTDKVTLSGRHNSPTDIGMSTHNDINTFTRGIKSRGPYGGPSFASFNNSKQIMQQTNTSARSKVNLPSGNSGKSMGRVAQKLSGGEYNNPRVENYQQMSKRMPKTASSNKGGSGYMKGK